MALAEGSSEPKSTNQIALEKGNELESYRAEKGTVELKTKTGRKYLIKKVNKHILSKFYVILEKARREGLSVTTKPDELGFLFGAKLDLVIDELLPVAVEYPKIVRGAGSKDAIGTDEMDPSDQVEIITFVFDEVAKVLEKFTEAEDFRKRSSGGQSQESVKSGT